MNLELTSASPTATVQPGRVASRFYRCRPAESRQAANVKVYVAQQRAVCGSRNPRFAARIIIAGELAGRVRLFDAHWHAEDSERFDTVGARYSKLGRSGVVICRSTVSQRASVIPCIVCLALSALTSAAFAQTSSSAPIDYGRAATRIVASLKLQRGERVLMRTDPTYFTGLVGPLQQQLRSAGASVLDPLSTEKILTADIVARTDVFIELPISDSGRQLAPPESAVLVEWLQQGAARRELHFHWSEGTRHADGTPAKHFPDLDRQYESALEIDYRALDTAQNHAISILRLGSVRVTTPAGTDLFFRTGIRPFNKQNGDASGARARAARVRVDREIELPAGVLRVAPIEESVFGQIVLPEVQFGTTIARGIVLQLDNGRITRVRAQEGQQAVEQALAAGGESAYHFREFGLGFNPKLSQSKDSLIPYYGYGAGVVRLSLGNNEELGGNVRGGFVRWFFFPDATVHVDFRYLVRDGHLLPDTDQH